ncbi:MAG: hypothetical protein HUU35_19405, partial [Armatimonadetes bacterium]|nr:hypothetical protein [Armatimonadota bacterium]
MAVPSLPVGLPLGTPHRPYTLMPGDSGLLVEDAWPSIYFGAERLPAIREKTNGAPWARSMLARLVAEAEGVLAEEPSQPLERIGWRHQFYSKSSGEHLLYERHSPHGFLDPASGGLEAGEEEHAAWVLLTHERTHRLLRSLALLHGLTGDARYAAWVREGLLRAVEFFGHDEFREGNRCRALYFQPLYDGPALTQMALAYDLTRDAACYSQADHQAIVDGIFGKGIPYQLEFLDEIGVHNMGCYVSAAVATCGQVLGRPEWVERGLRHPLTGLHGQLRDGVRSGPDGQPDGFWYEGTMFYHFYSLCPLITLWELARTLGDPLAADADVRERLAAGLLAPVNLADSRDRLPILGDLGDPRVMSLETYRHLYEWAAGRLDPERFGPIAARLAQRCGRDGWTALAFGAT